MEVELFHVIPQYLAAGAFVIFAVVALLRTVGVVVPKLRTNGAQTRTLLPRSRPQPARARPSPVARASRSSRCASTA